MIFISLMVIIIGISPFTSFSDSPFFIPLLSLIIGVLVFYLRRIKNREFSRIANLSKQLAGEVKSETSHTISDNLSKIAEKQSHLLEIVNNLQNPGYNFIPSKNSPIESALFELNEKLKNYTKEEKIRKWNIEGANILNNILRAKNNDVENLSIEVVGQMVKFLECAQGAMYIVDFESEDEPFLELKACYAYGKKKHVTDKLYAGEGLIGQNLLERETVLLTEVPEDYIQITSGLGEALPRCIVIVPLLLNDKYYGALELASFNEFTDYHISFLEESCKNLASVVGSVLMNSSTKSLLEEAQILTQELESNEEEMRQNLMELAATKDEIHHKQQELNGIFTSLDNSMVTMELDGDGKVMKVNKNFVDLLEFEAVELMEKTTDIYWCEKDQFQTLWKNLIENKPQKGDFKFRSKSGNELWLDASFTPILGKDGEIDKIMMMGHDISEKKMAEIEFEKLSLVADNTDNSVIITDKDGFIEFVNKGFTRLTGYTFEEVKGKKPGSFLQGKGTNQETVENIRKKLKERSSINEEILNYTKTGESYWVSLAISPILNEAGELENFISIQADITETKRKSLDFSNKLKAFDRSNLIAEFDTEGEILEANDNFKSKFQISNASLKNYHHQSFTAPHLLPENAEKIAAGQYVSGEFEFVLSNNTKIWLRGTYNPIQNISGKIYKIILYASDITAERHLELDHKKKKIELDGHMEAIHKTIASVEFDLSGKILGANNIFCSITGYQPADLIGKSESVLLSEEERLKPQHKIMWENLIAGQFFSGEFKFLSQSGKELWLNGTFNPILDIEGKPYKIMMFAQFTTDEKEKLHELNATLKCFNRLIPILELNPNGTIKSCNEYFSEKHGFKKFSLKRKSIWDLTDGRFSQKAFEKVKNDPNPAFKINLQTKDGEFLTYDKVSAYLVTNFESQVVKVIFALQ